MACPTPEEELPPTLLLAKALSMVPLSHYFLTLASLLLVFLYNFLEIHFLGDLRRGLRGDRVALTFDPASKIYQEVASKCRSLHGRYLVTPWLASPHLQTAFLNFFGRAPVFCYRRQIYTVNDGGTIALDWLLASDVAGVSSESVQNISKDDSTPIAIVVPGLTSDSASPYLRHIVHKTAKQGWNVVVGNHRGLGGMSITSDRFYNAGWTDDVREVVNYLHREYPKAPLFAIGTSIGANILVKYLGEEGENTPIAGAASICSTWDLVVCDRFINRKLVQRLYDRALAYGLKGYAQLHEPALTRLANWDGISNSRTVRDFDNHATCIVGKYETVDTYYRHCSAVNFVKGISVPLLCVSALDDPVCTSEAIPWDECRANKNIVLATLPHGGHLAFFKGLTAHSLWWVGAVNEFLSALYSSPHMHGPKKIDNTGVHFPLESSIDKTPYVNVMEDGMIAAVRNSVSEEAETMTSSDGHPTEEMKPHDVVAARDESEDTHEARTTSVHEIIEPSGEKAHEESLSKIFDGMISPVKRSINQLSRQSGKSMWLLAYIAIVTTWPLVGSALLSILKKRLKGVPSVAGLRR
ncbi:embryogenesis-associated protein EMB8-like [Iris pallida]|uniref:Embryogenesis-associated protein EMB8-like n=1 Tax=Iris pallida TaxID=29817 RepID=A0AAX6FEI2_IRIPA|nr:embryogenesis-associated protein EMB8-like [Iris pallida]